WHEDSVVPLHDETARSSHRGPGRAPPRWDGDQPTDEPSADDPHPARVGDRTDPERRRRDLQALPGRCLHGGPRPDRLTFVEHLYDPDFFARNYVVVDGIPNKRSPETGKLHPTRRNFGEDFEGADSLGDLIGPRRGWTNFTLQSPEAPTIPEYNALRRRLLGGRGDFLDNRIEISQEHAHFGSSSRKCVSEPPSRGMVTAKASLSTSLLHFVRGDDVWFSGWYFVPEGSSLPFTLMDLESTWIKEHPGMRIMLDPPGHLMLELKWADKPKYRQAKGREVRFPVGEWAEVRLHLGSPIDRTAWSNSGKTAWRSSRVGDGPCRWRARSTTTSKWPSAPTASDPTRRPSSSMI
ncbi:hypothetical protein HK102_012449, partial [Quaeritorhiza haematococci]